MMLRYIPLGVEIPAADPRAARQGCSNYGRRFGELATPMNSTLQPFRSRGRRKLRPSAQGSGVGA